MDPAYEQNLVVNNKTLQYSGIFRAQELFHVINQLLRERGYTRKEKKTEETVTEQGRRTYVELRPFKIITNYARIAIKIKINLDDVTEVVEEVVGEKRTFDQGNVEIVFDAWVLTDYDARWILRPWVYFLKGVINKYLYRFPIEGGLAGQVAADTAYLYTKLKALLNSYKHQAAQIIKEEDVVRKVAEEIGKGKVETE